MELEPFAFREKRFELKKGPEGRPRRNPMKTNAAAPPLRDVLSNKRSTEAPKLVELGCFR